MKELTYGTPMEIETESFAIIGRELAEMGISLPPENELVIKRTIHATADFDYAKNLVFTPEAAARGIAALKEGAHIVTDTNMARSGVNRSAMEKLGIEAHCFMADADVAKRAKKLGTTRAVVSMDCGAEQFPDAVYAVGNAPTALLRMEELIQVGKMRPALIIAVPVGFVNVVKSKQHILSLAREQNIPAIVALGRKGGSTVAAAICNALLYQAGGR